MTASEFLACAEGLNVRVWREADDFRYSAPHGVMTPRLEAALCQHRDQIMEILDARAVGDDIEAFDGFSGEPGEGSPLSYEQQRIWFVQKLDPTATAYNEVQLLRLSGPLDRECLTKSLAFIIGRHDALRTVFPSIGDAPVQVVREDLDFEYQFHDLREESEEGREILVDSIVRKSAREPFDLEQGPVFRSGLIQTGAETHLLWLVVHHIAWDAWSRRNLLQELGELYASFSENRAPDLPPISQSYVDYAVQQRNQEDDDDREQRLAELVERLQRVPPVLPLPDDTQSHSNSGSGSVVACTLSGPLRKQLEGFARSQGGTPFMVFLAVLKALLFRLTRQEEIVVGSPFASRPSPESESLIGMFLNTILFHSQIDSSVSFQSFFEDVRDSVINSYNYSDIPFERIVQELKLDRHMNRSPIFQVFINMFSLQQEPVRAGDVEIEDVDFEDDTCKFDIALNIRDRNGVLHLKLLHDTSRFSVQRMETLLRQYQGLLNQVLQDPECCLGQYSLVDDAAAAMLPNPSEVLPLQFQAPVSQIVERVVQERPNATSVSMDGVEWTYADLYRRSTDVARRLIVEGVAKGSVVAVTGARSPGMIGACLGVFLSGGVLVTLDPDLPVARRRLMLREASAVVVIQVGRPETQETLLDGMAPIPVIELDRASGELAGASVESDALSLPPIQPEDQAYIFFTSGTAGTPKAVLGNHQGLSHFLTWQKQEFGVGPQDRVSQLTALSFDVVLRDMFLPLVSGGTLCIPTPDDRASSTTTLEFIERERITTLHMVPAFAQLCVSDPPPAKLKRLKRVFFAGEPLIESLVTAWRKHVSSEAEIINLYGTTETTLAKCFLRLGSELRSGVQPAGRPMPGCQVLVLNRKQQLCGVGEPGEIYIRTPYRTLGYLHSGPDNTRFCGNPLNKNRSDIVYRTGDGGRYLPDGALEILGRLDDQVKINGVRIEPAEIAACLTAHDNIRSAVVSVCSCDSGDRSLVAYVVPNATDSDVVRALRRYAREQLPSTLVPSMFVVLAELPLGPNGKVNRKALPAPNANVEPDEIEGLVEPKDAFEERVLAVWSQVLDRKLVGMNTDFFEQGGHSLLAMKLINRLSKEFHLQVPLSLVFQHSTLAGQSDVLKELSAGDSELMEF